MAHCHLILYKQANIKRTDGAKIGRTEGDLKYFINFLAKCGHYVGRLVGRVGLIMLNFPLFQVKFMEIWMMGIFSAINSMMGRIYQLITSVYAVTRWESLININECVSLMYILEMSIFLCKCIYPYYLLLMSMVVPNRNHRYCTVVSPDGMGNQLRGQHISYEGNLSFPTAI